MKIRHAAFLLLALTPGVATAQTAGDPAAGKVLWDGADTQCKNCHGMNGEGAFGPDLAGRGLSASEFRVAARKPWGIMPAYTEGQYSDAELNNLAAYFATLPKHDQPGKWRYEVSSTMPKGQQLLLGLGCGQCHQPSFVGPRGGFGATDADFNTFKSLVYTHTATVADFKKLAGEPVPPRVRMGNFNPVRISEDRLQEIFDWARNDIGFRVPLEGKLSVAKTDEKGTTYLLDVLNAGIKDKGWAAGGITISLIVPAGANVVGATGTGYKGAHVDDAAKATVATWELPRLAAAELQNFTITLTTPTAQGANLKGTINWAMAGTRPTPDQAPIAPVSVQ